MEEKIYKPREQAFIDFAGFILKANEDANKDHEYTMFFEKATYECGTMLGHFIWLRALHIENASGEKKLLLLFFFNGFKKNNENVIREDDESFESMLYIQENIDLANLGKLWKYVKSKLSKYQKLAH